MTGYELYVQFSALLLYFTKPDYQYFKYDGKIKRNEESYKKNKYYIFFERFAKLESDHFNIMLSYFVYEEKYSLYSFKTIFKRHYDKFISEQKQFVLRTDTVDAVSVFNQYITGKISPLEFASICYHSNAIGQLDQTNDLLWREHREKFIRLRPFLRGILNT